MNRLVLAASALIVLPTHPLAQEFRADPSLAGLDVDAVTIQPLCATGLREAFGPGCLQASSTPTLGMLYPLSSRLFVHANGNVGVGTTAPQARLHVNGDVLVESALRFAENSSGVQFSSYAPPIGALPVPMMRMFEGGSANADRMILAHSPAYDTWGLLYRDASDEFVFQQANGVPVLTVDMLSRHVVVDGNAKLGVGRASPTAGLDVYSPGTAARVETTSIGGNGVVLEVRGRYLSPDTYDLIRCVQPGFPLSNVAFRATNRGDVYADGAYTGPADFAEMLSVSTGATSVEPGDLVELDPEHPNRIRLARAARSTLVCGVYSTEPGFVGSTRDWSEALPDDPDSVRLLTRADMAERYDEVPVAVVGVVPVKVTAENGPIAIGDLLVSSNTPGHAMRDPDARIGTVVGKALEELEAGTGTIRMLVTLQ